MYCSLACPFRCGNEADGENDEPNQKIQYCNWCGRDDIIWQLLYIPSCLLQHKFSMQETSEKDRPTLTQASKTRKAILCNSTQAPARTPCHTHTATLVSQPWNLHLPLIVARVAT